jgi:RNA polymerase sigma-70 factor (ECF subfamily)
MVDWARRWGARGPAADDVAQLVLMALVRQFKSFHYDPARSFRAWLKTVTLRVWTRFQREDVRALGTGAAGLSLFSSLEARDDMVEMLRKQTDREALEAVLPMVRRRVGPRTWEAFRLTAIEGLDGRTVAERLGMSLSSVYVARHNVRARLAAEIRKIFAD